MNAITIISFITIIASTLIFFLINKKKRTPKLAKNNWMPNAQEIDIIKRVENQLSDTADWFVVRSDDEWIALSKEYNFAVPPKAFTLRSMRSIYIRETDNQTFAKLCIHELNHIKGYDHGEKMFTQDVIELNKYFDKYHPSK